MKTVNQILQQYTEIPAHEKEILCAHVLKCPREYIIAHPELEIGTWHYYQIKRLLRKRSHGIPIAYITGHKEFFGLDFVVNKHVLIPRPDTEVLVEAALEKINERRTTNNEEEIILIDVGTGTGCIPIAIMKTSKHRNIKTFATDISRKAIKIARQNAKKYNTDITFLHGNLLSPISNSKFQISNLIITANLPYLTEQQFEQEPSIQHEPKHALVADNHGLALYEQLLNQITSSLVPRSSSLFFEIDPSQTLHISQLTKTYLSDAHIHIHQDLAGHDRVVEINL